MGTAHIQSTQTHECKHMSTIYQVTVPAGVRAGDTFGVEVNGQQMLVTCPPGTTAGQTIQLQMPSLPTVSGVPVTNGIDAGSVPVVCQEAGPKVTSSGGVEYFETEQISGAGWACLICGIFFFPLNLIGLCMTEKRVVAVRTY